MRLVSLTVVALLAACASEQAPTPTADNAGAAHDLIYGADDRREAYELADPAHIAVSNSTVAVLDVGDLSSVPGGVRIDTSQIYGARYGLCSSEPYRDQPTTPFCSGFLVGPDLVATAGHCIDGSTCPSVAFAFGFEMLDANTVQDVVGADDVYFCAAVVARAETSTDDFAVVRLDRPVAGHLPLAIRRAGSIGLGAPVAVAGHPAGIPMKVAGGATVRSNGHPNYFESNLDTYGGNSGSPVFDANGVVEGILVRGNTDFVTTGKGRRRCQVSNECDDNGCPGWEDVSRIARIVPFVPVGGCDVDADCDDGDGCNGAETCNGGACAAGNAPDCGDGDACTVDACLSQGGGAFVCDHPAANCDDGDACTVESCDPATGCASTPIQCPAGQACSNGACVDVPQCVPLNGACDSTADCCSGKCHKRHKVCR